MSFFKSVTSNLVSRSRDTVLKESLINNLSECVKDIQYTNQFEENFHSVLGSNETTNTLCMALEAIFLHGLKDTFLRKAKNALSGDPDLRPQPNFWPLVLVLSHRQNIDQISSLPQINNEIGQCRAWLRIAFNECLLSSYMSTLLKNISAVKPFYNKSALVCDSEILEVAQKLIEGLESCVQFNLPINSSLLNQWPEQVLMLAGIWVPTMRVAPIISVGLDISTKMASTPTNNVSSVHILDEEEENDKLKWILQKKSTLNQNPDEDALDYEDVPSTSVPFTKNSPVEIEKEETQEKDCITSKSPSSADFEDLQPPGCVDAPGNAIYHRGWSTDNDELNASIHSNTSHGSSLIKTPEKRSLSSLIDNSNTYGEDSENKNPLRETLEKLFEQMRPDAEEPTQCNPVAPEVTTPEDLTAEGLDFEIVPNTSNGSFTVAEIQRMKLQLGILSREHGLDNQNYKCKGCQDLLGSTISKAKVCGYTGEYYCTNCMDEKVFIIPARVIHNWDFKRYPVSKKSALFLLEFQHHPWIDMKKLNPKIYNGVSDMAGLLELRVQLNFLRAYIFSCREPVIEELQKRVWPREYLYHHLHTYTISDLAQIPNGSLVLQLERVVSFARAHVVDCWLCSQKGFICEVCRDPQILYPFETSTTYRCNECSSVFHAKCLNSSMPCPKCQRKLNRTQDTSLLDAVKSHFNK